MKIIVYLVFSFFLVACSPEEKDRGSSSRSEIHMVDPEEVWEELQDLGATDWKEQERKRNSMRPNSYREAYEFILPSVAPKGGQVIFFDERKHGEVMRDYFQSFTGILACPYVYLSADGLILFQLNSGLTPDEAKEVENIIR